MNMINTLMNSMDLRLVIANIYVPQFLRKRNLELLFDATADAFRVAPPSTKGLTSDECLKLYAQFTRKQANEIIHQGDIPEIQFHLFKNAYQIGQQFKANFKVKSMADVMRISHVIYKTLKIEFQGKSQGNVVIKRCFFSDYYSSDVCQLVSSLDAGLLAGLSGGGKLSFFQRITEGNECCHAYLEMRGG